MLNLHFITAQPDTVLYCWQTRVQIVNFRQYGYSQLLRVLVLVKQGHEINSKWLELEKEFSEVKFFWYIDTENIYQEINKIGYEPLLRPNLMMCHFNEFPELSKAAIFYLDSDVLFTKPMDFSNYLYDTICYLSDTVSYIGAKYFDSKENQVLPDNLDEYKKIDVLEKCLNHFNLSRKVAEENEKGSGGAQYLLKNTDANFWKEVYDGAIFIKGYLSRINRQFFKNEDEGFQSWCADMWAVLFSLWKRGIKTECSKDLDFAWSTDPINLINDKKLYHDAGMTPAFNGGFHKSQYRYSEPKALRQEAFNEKYCTSWYVSQIKKAVS